MLYVYNLVGKAPLMIIRQLNSLVRDNLAVLVPVVRLVSSKCFINCMCFSSCSAKKAF